MVTRRCGKSNYLTQSWYHIPAQNLLITQNMFTKLPGSIEHVEWIWRIQDVTLYFALQVFRWDFTPFIMFMIAIRDWKGNAGCCYIVDTFHTRRTRTDQHTRTTFFITRTGAQHTRTTFFILGFLVISLNWYSHWSVLILNT